MPTVDLRSDTLTRPSEGMRAAMAAAEVGDDVYGEDPTVRALEEEVAGRFGHEAAVYVPSGTMGNQICLRLWVAPAEELLCHADDHIVTYENGAAADHGGIQTRTLSTPAGQLSAADIAAQLRPAGWGTVATKAVSVEQTHNRGGGSVHPLAELQAIRQLTRPAGVALHCDGARIWNAHVATGTSLAAYGELFDSLSVCLSKGLGAPVGSVLVTSQPAAERARVLRRRLGGGMRQAGVIAAAGRYALAHNVERLADDHRRASWLGDALGPDLVPVAPETNIVRVELGGTGWGAPELAAAARAEGVLASVVGPQRLRLVTHLDVDDGGIKQAADVLRRLASTGPCGSG